MTKHEVNFLKVKISSHIVSQPFERQSIAKSSWIDGIRDSRTRQELYQRYKNVAEQARSNIMTAYIECAEGQKQQCQQQCQQQYDLAVKEIRDIQKTLPSDQPLTEAMRNLIQPHLANISKCIECIYKLKAQLFHLKSKIQ
ncbi:unnamed protein product [Rotaria sp. Silwood2]|nr:unnamed protein product [Rotaria sp. Silwood2]CAF4192271.1 unnamed protein product [Rotaria sp. Silwood2]